MSGSNALVLPRGRDQAIDERPRLLLRLVRRRAQHAVVEGVEGRVRHVRRPLVTSTRRPDSENRPSSAAASMKWNEWPTPFLPLFSG